MAIGIELKGESYGLLVDAVGEVMKLAEQRLRGQAGQSRSAARRASPPASIRLEGQLLVVLDVDRVLDIGTVPSPREHAADGAGQSEASR